ncbi:hypothetical protein ACFWFI_08080 [Streptomyces sp. NPDC060209]|uniref:hypothetical protein n=1 Tax=Streptomyces sp. NPDC060209 TaxID=3347073 RepID=UPI00365C08E6
MAAVAARRDGAPYGLGRVLKVGHDGVDRVPIERSLVVDPVLKHALSHLRFVKSQQPFNADPVDFADWRERVAGALDALVCVLVFEEDRARARAEAAAALEQATEARQTPHRFLPSMSNRHPQQSDLI